MELNDAGRNMTNFLKNLRSMLFDWGHESKDYEVHLPCHVYKAVVNDYHFFMDSIPPGYGDTGTLAGFKLVDAGQGSFAIRSKVEANAG